MELLTTKTKNMKKLIIILCVFLCSCATQKTEFNEVLLKTEIHYDENGDMYIIEYWYDPKEND